VTAEFATFNFLLVFIFGVARIVSENGKIIHAQKKLNEK
jgi:hypothetical protein